MTRYVTRSTGWVEDEVDYDTESFRPVINVDGPAVVDTGLIAITGEPIYRLPLPVGFGRDDEW